MTSFPVALMIRFLPASISLPWCFHFCHSKICDLTNLVCGRFCASWRIVATMAKRKSPTDIVPIPLPSQCITSNFEELLMVKRKVTFLSISTHRIPSFPCHHSEHPRSIPSTEEGCLYYWWSHTPCIMQFWNWEISIQITLVLCFVMEFL